MKGYCVECNSEQPLEIVDKKETYTVREIEVTVDARVKKCKTCKTELFDEELDEATLHKVYNEVERIEKERNDKKTGNSTSCK